MQRCQVIVFRIASLRKVDKTGLQRCQFYAALPGPSCRHRVARPPSHVTAAVERFRSSHVTVPSPRRLVVASRYLIIVPSTKVTSFRRAIVVVALPPRGVRRRALLVTARRRHDDSSSRVSFGKIFDDHRPCDDMTSRACFRASFWKKKVIRVWYLDGYDG